MRCDLPPRKSPCVTSELVTRPLCMLEVDKSSASCTLTYKLGRKLQNIFSPLPNNREEAVKRFGGNNLTGDAITMVPQIIEINKKMLSLDGGLMTVAILMRGDQMIDTCSLEFYDQELEADCVPQGRGLG